MGKMLKKCETNKKSEMKTLIWSLWPERWHRNCLWYLSMYCDGDGDDDDDDDDNSDIRPHFEEPLIIIMMWLNIFIAQSSKYTCVSLSFFIGGDDDDDNRLHLSFYECLCDRKYWLRSKERERECREWIERWYRCLCISVDGVEVCIISRAILTPWTINCEQKHE